MPTADQLHAIAIVIVAATPAISWIGYLWRPRESQYVPVPVATTEDR